jgi:hypothetical protein
MVRGDDQRLIAKDRSVTLLGPLQFDGAIKAPLSMV